ncbi:MAG: HEAT repeat domain-containing protein, partial [Deltaproteobacteria bacterium]|nr:HEAT repeat domain-containing protein [Deltaproteobacteria bacterium]
MNEASVTLSPADRERVSGVERLVALGESSVPALIERLIDPSWAVRRAVIAGLASLGDAAVAAMVAELVSDRSSEAKIAALVDALVASTGEVDGPLELLGEDAAAVVADAAAILGRRRSRRAVPTLERWAAHSDDNVAVASMEALASIGAGAGLDAVIRAADSGQFFRVFPAIDVLARSRDPRALEPLARLLGDPVCSLEAARALGRTGQLSAAPALAAMLGAGSEPLVRAAAVALAEIDDAQLRSYGARDTIVPALRALGDGSGAARRVERCFEGALVEERIALCRVLGWLGADSAAASLVSLLGEDPVVADVAAHALQRLGPVGHRHILSALRHGDGARRALLVPLVPLHFDATPDLLACLEDSDPNVRAHACERLGRIGNVLAVPALFARLEDVDAGVVQSATGALHALGSEETKRRALEGVRAPDAKVRRVAVRLIGYFGWADATPVLRDALADPDERVREAATQALAFVDHPDARALLLERAAIDDPRARAAAMRTLGRVERTDTTTAALLRGLSDPHAWARYYACQSLGRFASPDSLAAILPLLDDAAGQVRVAAIEAVSRFDDVRAIDALLAATRSSDPDASRAA